MLDETNDAEESGALSEENLNQSMGKSIDDQFDGSATQSKEPR